MLAYKWKKESMSLIGCFAYKSQNCDTLSQVRLEIAYKDNAFRSAKDIITFFHLLSFLIQQDFMQVGESKRKTSLPICK